MSFSFSYDHFHRFGAARRSERVRTRDLVRLMRDGKPDIQVQLIDVSAEGFLLECEELLTAGSTIWIEMPSVRLVSAKVIWQKNGRVGGEFSHRLKWRTLQRFRLVDDTRSSRAARPGRIFK